MNKLLIGAVMSLIALTANAEDVCEGQGEAAKLTMEHRQYSNNIQELIDLAGGNPLLRSMVIGAYKKPYMSTEKMKQQYIKEFKNEVLVLCYETMGGDK